MERRRECAPVILSVRHDTSSLQTLCIKCIYRRRLRWAWGYSSFRSSRFLPRRLSCSLVMVNTDHRIEETQSAFFVPRERIAADDYPKPASLADRAPFGEQGF